MSTIINLSDIKIKWSKRTMPTTSKITACYDNYRASGRLDRAIVVDDSNVLMDGYCAYLIAKMMGMEKIEVAVIDTTRLGKLQNGNIDDAAKIMSQYAAALMNGTANVSPQDWLKETDNE